MILIFKIFALFFLFELTSARKPNRYYHSWGTGRRPRVERRTLDQIYQAALEEGGNLVVYAGGDFTGQYNTTKEDFLARFPGIDLQLIVDYSKYHDARIDFQINTNSIVFDVAHLQTLQNFPRWAKMGVLLNYIPLNYDRVYSEFKQADGTYYGILINTFSNLINTDLLPDPITWPTEARDYLSPAYKNRLIATYPNDDDAVLFMFKQIVDKYGIQYLYDFKNQNPVFVRGSHTGEMEVGLGNYPATFTSAGPLIFTPGTPRFVLPKYDPFVMWPQTGAIFKDAPHPEAAKLYMSWSLSKEVQESLYSFSVRDDVPPPEGYGYCGVFEYENCDPLAFGRWMEDRRKVETFRRIVDMMFGEVVGNNTANSNSFGLQPTREE